MTIISAPVKVYENYEMSRESVDYDNSSHKDLPVPHLQLVWDKPRWGSDYPQETAEKMENGYVGIN